MKIYQHHLTPLKKILSFLSVLCKSPTHIITAAWMQMTEVCVFGLHVGVSEHVTQWKVILLMVC